jgi:hypothetical protein
MVLSADAAATGLLEMALVQLYEADAEGRVEKLARKLYERGELWN